MKEATKFVVGEWYQDVNSGCAFRCKTVYCNGEESVFDEYGPAAVDGGWIHVKVTPIED